MKYETAWQQQMNDFVAEVQAILLARLDKRKLAEITESLNGIDPSKSYPTGTCATHRGGTIKAIRATDPVTDGRLGRAGWEVLADGIAELLETMSEDRRTMTMMVVTTSGLTYTRTITFPCYRGDYVRGAEYVIGDGVTHAGKLWMCIKPGTEPGGDGWEEWQPDEAH